MKREGCVSGMQACDSLRCCSPASGHRPCRHRAALAKFGQVRIMCDALLAVCPCADTLRAAAEDCIRKAALWRLALTQLQYKASGCLSNSCSGCTWHLTQWLEARTKTMCVFVADGVTKLQE